MYRQALYMRITHPPTLKALIRQRGLTYAALGAQVGCTAPFLCHLAQGRRSGATPELAERIAEALDVDLDLIFVDSTTADSGSSDRDQQHAA
jgi:transcriptional regulator with XRE-family HTH domain